MADEPVAVANTLASPLGPDRVGQVWARTSEHVTFCCLKSKSALLLYLLRCARLEGGLPGLCQAASQALEWNSCGMIGVWQHDIYWKNKRRLFCFSRESIDKGFFYSCETYWQSDGQLPHLVNVQVTYFDFKSKENS